MSVCFRHCRHCAVEDCPMRISDEVICDHYKPKINANNEHDNTIPNVSDSAKQELIKRFEDFPVQIIAMAWVYAVGLNKFGVDLSKEWETVTQKRSELDLAYRQGRMRERERWEKHELD